VLKILNSHKKTKVIIHLKSAADGSSSYLSSKKTAMFKSILSKGRGQESP